MAEFKIEVDADVFTIPFLRPGPAGRFAGVLKETFGESAVEVTQMPNPAIRIDNFRAKITTGDTAGVTAILSDTERVKGMLQRAGWSDPSIQYKPASNTLHVII